MIKFHRIIPKIVLTLCFNCDAWIVGSNAINSNPESDWDVIVPPDKWADAALILKNCENFTMNSFGGWKVDGHIDVWPSTINEYIQKLPKNMYGNLSNPKFGITLKIEDIQKYNESK